MRCHHYYYFVYYSSMLLLLFLLFPVCMALPLGKRETRYFTEELVLPPLQPIAQGTVNEYSKSLPLLYTNDPKMISHWLAEHISHNGCVLGFDVEVGVHKMCFERAE